MYKYCICFIFSPNKVITLNYQLGGREESSYTVSAFPTRPWRHLLTCTYACLIPRLVCRIITVQPFVWITDISFIAEVPRLLGTHLTAPTAVPHQAHSRSTIWLLTRACTGPVAKLFPRVHFQSFCKPALRWRVQLPWALGPTAEHHLIKKKQFLIPMYNFIETRLNW